MPSQFASSGDGLAVASQLELAVKVAFSTVYGYEQIGRDE
jgi:hypothetical protein